MWQTAPWATDISQHGLNPLAAGLSIAHQTAMTLLKRPPTSLRDKARSKRARGHLRRALRLYGQLCDSQGHDPDIWRERGEVELELGRREAAATSWFRCADILARSGKVGQARDLMTRVVTLDASAEMAGFLSFLGRHANRRQPAEAGREDDRVSARGERVVVAPVRVMVPSMGIAHDDYPMVARAVLASRLFSRLRSDYMHKLFTHGFVLRFTAGTSIRLPASARDDLLLVAEGMVSVGHPMSDTLTQLVPGDLLQADGQELPAGSMAAIDSAILVLSRATMDWLRNQSPSLGRRVDRLVHQRTPHLALGAHELFADMEPQARREFLRRSAIAELPPGIDVTREGEKIDALYIVLTGDLKGSCVDGTIGAFRTGDLFGHRELLDGSPASATVTTESATRLAAIPRSLFAEVISSQPQVLARLAQASAV